MTIAIASETRSQYSLSTHIPRLALAEIWKGEPLWPENDDTEEVVYILEKIRIFRGALRGSMTR